jgi:hypothetical protein
MSEITSADTATGFDWSKWWERHETQMRTLPVRWNADNPLTKEIAFRYWTNKDGADYRALNARERELVATVQALI